ncbi:MAG TPA: hypothetical protein VNM24_08460 [Burkholderiales bacterium]|jgi:hypothetical protein|nr:hypothetical protein [Burkholderiales bacterium]
MLDPLSHLTDRPVRSLLNVLQEGVQTLFLLLLVCLLALGLGGLVYKAVGPEGWLEATLGRIWHAEPVYAIVLATALVLGGVWVRWRIEKLPLFGKGGDWMVYACLALGLFFAVRLAATGTL